MHSASSVCSSSKKKDIAQRSVVVLSQVLVAYIISRDHSFSLLPQFHWWPARLSRSQTVLACIGLTALAFVPPADGKFIPDVHLQISQSWKTDCLEVLHAERRFHQLSFPFTAPFPRSLLLRPPVTFC
eukprot:RCo018728